MSAVAVAFAMILALTGLGRPLARRLGVALTGAEAWALAPVVGMLPLAALVDVVGTWWYRPLSMGLVLAATLVAAFFGLRRERPNACTVPGGMARWLAAACLVLVLLAALAALAPPADHDTLRYHLTLPRRDLEMGRIAVIPGWSVYEFFPPLMALLTRQAYALAGAEGAQMLNVALTALAALWAGLLARRLGGSAETAWLAGLLFLAQRVVINLAPAVTVDLPLAGVAAAAATLALVLVREKECRSSTALLLGLALAALVNIKYHGMVAATAILTTAFFAAPRRLPHLASAGLVAGLSLLPLLARNHLLTGNPVFPVAHPVFGPGNVDIFGRFAAVMAERTYAPGHPLDLVWTMFVDQNAFDGLQFGFPLLLIGLPFALLRDWRPRAACLAVILAYGLAWWAAMPHLLRFLLPILALLTALAALGLAEVAAATSTQPWFRRGFALLMGLALAVQTAFVGSSALHRLPAALGLMDIRRMLEAPAFVYYSLVSPCLWLDANLRPGERYLALTNDPSALCPQAAALPQVPPDQARRYYTAAPPLPPSDGALAALLAAENVRYVLVATNLGADDEPLVFGKHRFDALVIPLLAGLEPLHRAPSGSVYDAAEVIFRLRRPPSRR